MEALFLSILKMSATASAVILAVLLARLLLMRAPKKYSYFLWAAVGFRMCCPFSLKSEFSLFRLLMPRTIHQTPQETVPVAAGASPWYAFPAPTAQASSASPSPGNVAMYSATAQGGTLPVETTASSGVNWLAVCAVIWIVGVVFLLGYSIVQEIRLRRSLATATRLRGNIYQSENVASPFLLGILRPPYLFALQLALSHSELCDRPRALSYASAGSPCPAGSILAADAALVQSAVLAGVSSHGQGYGIKL